MTHQGVGLKLPGVENAALGPGARHAVVDEMKLVVRAKDLQNKCTMYIHHVIPSVILVIELFVHFHLLKKLL